MKKMSFIEHLEEMRIRLIKSVLFIFVFSIISYCFSDDIISFLINPIIQEENNLQVLKITSLFLIKIGVSIIFGIFVSAPFILYQLFKFILPAFENKMNHFKIIFISFLCMMLVLSGLLFGYKLLIPISLSFFNSLSVNLNFVELNYTLENYLFYMIWILMVSALIFQIPVLICLLVKIGILTIDSLTRNRKYVIVLFFILGAVLSPPDPISQLLIVLPLILLFEISVIISRFIS